MHYLGDLVPFRSSLSLSKGHFSTGIGLSYHKDDVVRFYIKYLHGKISGSDALTNDPFRRKRNLSFESPIDEFGAGVEISLSSTAQKLSKYQLDFFLIGGINYFHFNPRALYKNKWIDLQPLGTEGQGSDSRFKTPYKLWQLSFPMGFGLDVNLNETMSLGFEILPRMTFSDYLDDVSSTYLGTQIQTEEQGELTAALANRTGEFLFGEESEQINEVSTGQQRGDSLDRDWYMTFSISIGARIGQLKKYSREKREKY